MSCAHLARPHDLVLIEQEDRHPGRVDEFVDLRLAAPKLGLRPAVGRRLAQAECLIGDQDVEAVLVGVHEPVEVLAQRLDLTGALAGDLAQRLGERP